jgi:Cellulase (glycosyl hydrolase family 5)
MKALLVSCMTATALMLTSPLLHPTAQAPTTGSRGPRIAVFLDSAFPTVDLAPIPRAEIDTALAGYDVSFLTLDRLVSELDSTRFDVLVMPYGSAFPKAGWPAVRRFLVDGGNWVNLGGVPFSVPVASTDGVWRQEPRTTAYHKQLTFVHAFPVSARDVARYQPGPSVTAAESVPGGFRAEEIYALDLRLTETKDYPAEDGTGGQRDARFQALVLGANRDGVPVAAPFVRIDRLLGDFAGGRWVLAAFKGSLDARVIRALAASAAGGAIDLVARPTYAGFAPGESPSVQLRLTRPRGDLDRLNRGMCQIEVLDQDGHLVTRTSASLEGGGALALGSATLTTQRAKGPRSGLYQVTATLPIATPGDSPEGSIRATTGFWIYEPAMLRGGAPLVAGRAFFSRSGKPYPITGTTYMASDVHRKFLFEPNPYLWDRDFAAMKRGGVNMVRTGIWTAWKNYMLDVGTLNEAALRSLDVFLLTARKYDIPVIFNLFAFLPETWGGDNPYLDPRSIQAQRAFVGALAQRYRLADDLVWDLINEPSFSSASQLWLTRPNYDAHEQAAWRRWLRDRYPAPTEAEHEARLHQVWGSTPGEPLGLPPLDDFRDRHIFGRSRPLKVLDYRLFAQDMFGTWVEEMTAAIRANGNPRQLITVGQDEGGITERPNPLLYGARTDFTCNHTWWNNDALLWDGVMTRRPDKPNLIEETGIMVYERMDGTAWRSESDARNLLERKLALAMASGGAGFIQWIWNTNPYMLSDNEAGIGFFHADGTARPELTPFMEFARFIGEHAGGFADREDEEVVLVVPQSQMYSVRNFATEATRRSVRAMSYHLGTPMRVVSEYSVPDLLGTPKLIVLPSPRVLSEQAWNGLLAAVERGAALLVTGPVDSDEHWWPVPRMAGLGLQAAVSPVAPEEPLTIDGTTYQLSYRGEKLERVETAVMGGDSGSRVHVIARGRGRVMWVPAPVELAEQIDATVALYRLALREAQIVPLFTNDNPDPSVLVLAAVFGGRMLFTIVSESSVEREVRFTPAGAPSAVNVKLPAQRAVLLWVDRATGKVIGQSRTGGSGQ